MHDKNKQIGPEQAKDAGLALVLASLLLYRFGGWDIFFLPALVFLLLTMTWPLFFKAWARIWFGFSELLGGVVSKIILTILFFGVATPVGLVQRAIGKDPLLLKRWKADTNSVLIDRSHLFSKKDLERPY